MDDKYIAILGGLVGSSFTIVVTKVFEYYQTSQLHKLSLKKELFIRKLNVFEKTVSYLTIAHTSITNMAVLLKTAMNENVTFTDEQSKDIFDRLQKNIDQVYQVTQDMAGSIDLYIDLKHDHKEVEDTQRFWELLGTINQLAHDVNFGYDLLKTATTEDDYRKMEIAIDLNEKALAKKVENLVDFSNSMRHKYLSMTSLLREELKSYE
ncbi:hypothetical protein [Sediminibacterium sp.]|uniref:hypothetical protein n=1 Tax=Sediminibacterium sp. TaxID=1917865 RepID=UPI0025DC036F|nr:hypothetical protein [Sediminibacterium sp.]MBW0178183.1 hypothetical protein [Sediminibacterium sp.]